MCGNVGRALIIYSRQSACRGMECTAKIEMSAAQQLKNEGLRGKHAKQRITTTTIIINAVHFADDIATTPNGTH